MGCLIKDSVMYSSGSARLFDLLDVDISNPSNGELLQYNSTNGKWVNSADVWDTMAKNGAHNLFNLGILPASYASAGVTHTVNASAGTVVFHRDSANSGNHYYVSSETFRLKAGNYILSAKFSVADGNVRIGIDSGNININNTTELAFTLSEDKDVNVYMFYSSSQSADVTISEIMIRLASDKSTTFLPYAPTNRDLAYVHDGWKKNGAYNLCPNEGSTQVSYGLTFTFNPTGYKKGVVHVTGTKSDSGSHGINFSGVFNLKAGTYKILDGLSNNNLGIALIDNATSTFILQTYNQHEAIFTLATDTEVRCTIVFFGTQYMTFDDYIYPIITTDLNATPADYVPHAKTNRELTEDTTTKDFTSSVTFTDTPSISVFKKVGNVITFSFRGSSRTAISVNETLFTLPTGYRPKENILIPFIIEGVAYGAVIVYTNGTASVSTVSSTSFTSGRVIMQGSFAIN